MGKVISDKRGLKTSIKVASWAGNSPQIIDSNYRAVDGVTASTCKKFWYELQSYYDKQLILLHRYKRYLHSQKMSVDLVL